MKSHIGTYFGGVNIRGRFEIETIYRFTGNQTWLAGIHLSIKVLMGKSSN
jgi:carbohydrate-selective porin OprB